MDFKVGDTVTVTDYYDLDGCEGTVIETDDYEPWPYLVRVTDPNGEAYDYLLSRDEVRSPNFVPHEDAGSQIVNGPRWDDVDQDDSGRPDYDTA